MANSNSLPRARGRPSLEDGFVSSDMYINGDIDNVQPTIHPSELRRDEEYILLTLAQGRELYGLQICTKIEEESNGQKRISSARLYGYLHTLEEKGFITSRWENDQDSDRKGARRKYYGITESGDALIRKSDEFRNALRSEIPN